MNVMETAPAPWVARSTVCRMPRTMPFPEISFEAALLEVCNGVVASGRRRDLVVQLEVRVDGPYPRAHWKAVARVTDELVSNAVEHGFYGRQRGRVLVQVGCLGSVGIRVSVSDDGWGFDSGPIVDGNGFNLLRQLGDVRLVAPCAPFVTEAAVVLGRSGLPQVGRSWRHS